MDRNTYNIGKSILDRHGVDKFHKPEALTTRRRDDHDGSDPAKEREMGAQLFLVATFRNLRHVHRAAGQVVLLKESHVLVIAVFTATLGKLLNLVHVVVFDILPLPELAGCHLSEISAESTYQLDFALLRREVLILNLDRRLSPRRLVLVHRDLADLAILLHDAASFAEGQVVSIATKDDEPAWQLL